jgi:predicted transcriptional regulator of viral defense system
MKYYDDFLTMKSFRFADAVKLIGNEKSAKSLLQQYKKKGYIALIKKGLYVAVNIVDKEPVLNKFAIASVLTDTSLVSFRSAFEYYGYTNQVSYAVSVTSEQKFNSFDFNGYNFQRMAPSIKSGVSIQSDGVRVSDIERTVLDSINSFEEQMGLEELLNCISSVPLLDEEKLLLYLEEYKKQFLYQKTGFLLEHFQNELSISSSFLDACKLKSGKSSRYLVKDMPKDVMSFDAKWHLTYPGNMWTDMLNGGYEDADI